MKWFGGGCGVGRFGEGQSVIKCKCCAEAKRTRLHRVAQVLEQANATFPETEFQGTECLGILARESEDS